MRQEEQSLIIELINSKFNDMSERQDIQTKAVLKQMEVGFDNVNSRIDSVVEQKKIQNGRIQKSEDKIEELKSQTSVWRFVQRKPYISIGLGLILAFGIVAISKHVTINEIIKVIF